jgi:hypothetical protein
MIGLYVEAAVLFAASMVRLVSELFCDFMSPLLPWKQTELRQFCSCVRQANRTIGSRQSSTDRHKRVTALSQTL